MDLNSFLDLVAGNSKVDCLSHSDFDRMMYPYNLFVPRIDVSSDRRSRLDASSDGSRLAVPTPPEKQPKLSSLKEASMEQSRTTLDPRISSIERNLAAQLPPLQASPSTPPSLGRRSSLSEPRAPRSASAVPFHTELSPIPSTHSSSKAEGVPEGPVLIDFIRDAILVIILPFFFVFID